MSGDGPAATAHASLGQGALPGVYEVPLSLPPAQLLAARAGFTYGWTEAVLKQNDSHHRMQLDAAVSVTPLPWLSGWLRLLGRYDRHTGSLTQSDYGVITETHLGARAHVPLTRELLAGAELALWAPAGDNAGKGLAATSGDLQLIMTYAPPQAALTASVALGLRADRTRLATSQPEQYSLADRLALGASDSTWAAREGVALTYRTGPVEWLAEWSYRMYFAHIARSPMWVRAGARYRINPSLQLEALLGVSPSKRPTLSADAAFWAVEPRVWAGLAAAYAWPVKPQPALPQARPEPPPEVAPAAPAPAPTPTAALQGQVLAKGGAGLADAKLTLTQGEHSVEQTTDELGKYAFPPLDAGSYELSVSAPGWKPVQQSVALVAGDTRELEVALERELPLGQIRGTVRRFNGQPIVAHVTVAELNLEQTTRDDGTFEIDVPPGRYTVAVTAHKFRQQSRTAQVDERGVAILIVELEPVR